MRGPISALTALVVALLLSVAIAAAAGGEPQPKPPVVEAGFSAKGTHGFRIYVAAYSDGSEGTVEIVADRHGASALYSAPATVTSDRLSADLGRLGRIDVTRRPSGRRRTVHPKCLGRSETYEPGTYEGTIEFNGEQGYTHLRKTSVPQVPTWLVFLGHAGSCSGGYGESSGPGVPGARLRGASYVGGRSLSFQVNKNGRHAKTVYEAQLRERHHGIRIVRSLSGTAPPNAFRFDPALRTATLGPPRPFSGSGSLARSEDSFPPLWSGDLKLDFPGRRRVSLAGPGVHVSLVHAHFTRSKGPYGEAGFRLRPAAGPWSSPKPRRRLAAQRDR